MNSKILQILLSFLMLAQLKNVRLINYIGIMGGIEEHNWLQIWEVANLSYVH